MTSEQQLTGAGKEREKIRGEDLSPVDASLCILSSTSGSGEVDPAVNVILLQSSFPLYYLLLHVVMENLRGALRVGSTFRQHRTKKKQETKEGARVKEAGSKKMLSSCGKGKI